MREYVICSIYNTDIQCKTLFLSGFCVNGVCVCARVRACVCVCVCVDQNRVFKMWSEDPKVILGSLWLWLQNSDNVRSSYLVLC